MNKRQKVMFSFFLIAFAYILFSAALTQNINIIVGNLSVLLFLAALYMDNSLQSKTILVLASAMMIINTIISFVANPMTILTFGGIINIILYIGIYFFALNVYRDNFNKRDVNYLIMVLALPKLIFSLYGFIDISVALMNFNAGISLNTIMIILNPLVSGLIPLAMIVYTWFRMKYISFN